MLDPRFKSFRLVSSFSDLDQAVFMVEVYDRQSLFSMLLKCHHVLHHVLEYETMVDYLNDEDFCLDNFEMLVEISELA
jgi:hypothetical protein